MTDIMKLIAILAWVPLKDAQVTGAISGFWLRGFHVQWYNLSVVPLLVKRALKRCVVLYVSQDYILTSVVVQIKNTNTVYIRKQELTTFI